MKHELKVGLIEKGGTVYYTCKLAYGHKAVRVVFHPLEKKWVVNHNRVTVLRVNITHQKGGVQVKYLCDDGVEYDEDQLHTTGIDAGACAWRMNKNT